MQNIKYSDLLFELMNRAKTTFGKTDIITQEKFLVAALDMIMGLSADEKDEAIIATELVFDRYVKDKNRAKEELLAVIEEGERSETAFTDFIDRLKSAEIFVRNMNVSEITASSLAIKIFQKPNDIVNKAVKKANGDSDEPTIAELFSKVLEQEAKDGKTNNTEAETNIMFEQKQNPRNVKNDISDLVSETERIRTELKKAVFGQDNAINVFMSGYFQAEMLSLLDESRTRPKATFLFAGPPGVGKTFLAEKVAEILGLPFMRFDMSEYSHKEANIEFCGSDKVYKNGKAGNVTSFVENNPKSVLLFDEIEKADINVIHLFLQMLDAGRLRDNFTDNEIPFKDTIIILTTNAGKQLYENSESSDFSSVSRKIIIKALQKDVNIQTGKPFFPSAICSRFASGNVVMFNHMGAHNLCSIAQKEIERHAHNLKVGTSIKFSIDEGVYSALMFAEGGTADARTVRSRAETFFNQELYELLRLVSSSKLKTKVKDIENVSIKLDISNAKKEVRELFETDQKARVLLFADEDTVNHCCKKADNLEISGVQDTDKAIALVKENNIDFVLIDIRCGAKNADFTGLNIEDIESCARDFFKFLREQKSNMPIYLLEDGKFTFSDEEKISFNRQGVRGTVNISRFKGNIKNRLTEIATTLHRQKSMAKLAKEKKLISFETAQSVSKNGKDAEITLFDLEMTVAVESEDSKNVMSAVSRPDVKFDDVIGGESAKKELTYFVEYLKNPQKYMGTGVKAPRGVLLYGPPGTGKTMLAKAMASESGVTFIATEGNQFLKKFVGEGSEKVHELFQTARKYAPSILFIDEIDAIAKERKGANLINSGNEETLTAFLTEMDGFVNDPSRPVFVLAATNFEVEPGTEKSLDPALMRRFDRRVYIELPTRDDRIKFLKMKIAQNKALKISELQIDNISIRATGMSLAELDSIVELALRSAIREGSTVVTDEIFEEAFETFNSGDVKKWDVSQLERVARHEAGHALICWLSGETPSYLTIVARGNHGGYMQHAEQEGKAIYTRKELLSKIRTSLGGRAAEIVYYGNEDGISTGAGGDLVSATNLAQQLVCSYGMDKEFGLAVMSADTANGAMSAEVRNAVNRILNEQMNKAVALISENKEKIDSLVDTLMTKNHLSGVEIESAILNNKVLAEN